MQGDYLIEEEQLSSGFGNFPDFSGNRSSLPPIPTNISRVHQMSSDVPSPLVLRFGNSNSGINFNEEKSIKDIPKDNSNEKFEPFGSTKHLIDQIDQQNEEPTPPEEESEEEEDPGMSSDYSQIERILEVDLKQLIVEYTGLKSTDTKKELLLKTIKLKHPIFMQLNLNAFKYLMEKG